MGRREANWLLAACLLLGGAAPLRADGDLRCKVLEPAGGVENVGATPDGRWLVASCKDETRLWNLKAAEPFAKPVVLRESAGAISPDGRWLMTAGTNPTIRLWDLKVTDPSAEGREVARVEA